MRKNYITNPYLEGLPGRWYKIKIQLTGPDTLPVVSGDIPVEIGVWGDAPLLIFPEGFSIIDRMFFYNPLDFRDNTSISLNPYVKEKMTAIYPGRTCFVLPEFFESEGTEGETVTGNLVFLAYGFYNE